MNTRSGLRGLPLRSSEFPTGTPLNHFFAWNEAKRWRDRRYVIACDLYALITALGSNDTAHQAAVAHLCRRPVILARRRTHLLFRENVLSSSPGVRRLEVASPTPLSSRRRSGPAVAVGTGLRRYDEGEIAGEESRGLPCDRKIVGNPEEFAVAVAQETVDCLVASIGSANIDKHAEVFAAFERLANEIDLDALARHRPQLVPSRRRPSPRRILVIRLSALGDFVQALGPIAAIRRQHRGDHISLLTTAALADFAGQIGFFDDVIIDRRPGRLDIGGWIALRRRLRAGRFDRVYDLQTSQRSAAYAALFRPGPMPEWSGVAPGCSHPHAYLDRDRQHTIDKQCEQLLMAGIYPTPLPMLRHLARELPPSVIGQRFVLLMPGSSPRHPAKRWPARRFGLLAEALRAAGHTPVIVGSAGEAALGAAIREVCPQAIDLVGRTDIVEVAALAEHAVLTVGNDTGITHLAAAAGCPVVVLFSGISDPDWCAPRGRLVRVLAVADLGDLEVDRVLTEIRRTLAQSGLPAPRAIRQEAPRAAVASGASG